MLKIRMHSGLETANCTSTSAPLKRGPLQMLPPQARLFVVFRVTWPRQPVKQKNNFLLGLIPANVVGNGPWLGAKQDASEPETLDQVDQVVDTGVVTASGGSNLWQSFTAGTMGSLA